VSRRYQDQVRRALREAWHKSMKHGDIICDWDRFSFSNRGLQSGISSHLLTGQCVSFVISGEHNSWLRPTCTTSLQTHTLSPVSV